MISIKTYPYNDQGISEIDGWLYGKNWPVAYIIYNSKEAYIGETLDAIRRTQQHLSERSLRDFEKITFITDKTYNKSTILDLESFLIKYIGADGQFRLKNGNAGISDHEYFMKDIYYENFQTVWQKLIEGHLAKHDLQQIENSNLFKYSPYKSLGREQEEAVLTILSAITKHTPGKKLTIKVQGGAGTGKTILGVYLVKLLKDILDRKKIIEEDELFEISQHRNLLRNISSDRIGLVIPQAALDATVEKVFDSVDGLNRKMVLRPKDVPKGENKYDILIVDEAHRLQRRKSLGRGYQSFDETNRRLGLGNNGTQLDWIMRCSDIQILFYDSRQTIRPSDIEKERFEEILQSYDGDVITIDLKAQFRCKAGADYIQYVNDVLHNAHPATHKKFPGYDIKVFDHFQNFWEEIAIREKEVQLCRVVSGIGWNNNCPKGKTSYYVDIEGKQYRFRKTAVNWVADPESINEIGDIHKIQGYDLCYAGVIFGPEISYDPLTRQIAIDKKNYYDVLGKQGVNDDELLEFILNIYQTLLTRGIYGTYIYACDHELSTYLKKYFC